MVTIIAAHLRESERGTFVSLELQGGPEMVQSQNTGRFYLTAKRCFISTTFNEEMAKGMVGTKFKGNIIRMECDPYEFPLPETGEIIQLSHRWDYFPEESSSTNVSAVSHA